MEIRTLSLQNQLYSPMKFTKEKCLIFSKKIALDFKQENAALYNGTGWQKETE